MIDRIWDEDYESIAQTFERRPNCISPSPIAKSLKAIREDLNLGSFPIARLKQAEDINVEIDLSGFSASSTVGRAMLRWIVGAVGCVDFLDKLPGCIGGGFNYKETDDVSKYSGIADAVSLAGQ